MGLRCRNTVINILSIATTEVRKQAPVLSIPADQAINLCTALHLLLSALQILASTANVDTDIPVDYFVPASSLGMSAHIENIKSTREGTQAPFSARTAGKRGRGDQTPRRSGSGSQAPPQPSGGGRTDEAK